MRAFGVFALAPLTLVALAACVWGAYEWANPPFTDDELRNFVDSWEPSAWVTMFALVAMGVVAVVSLPVAVLVKRRLVRALAVATALLAIVGGGLVYRNHVELTQRVTRLTGQTFGGFNCLGIF